MHPRIYVYKITFVGQPHWYWGVHKERSFEEPYMGSPKTHKEFWKNYQPIKEIIAYFEYSEEGWEQALTKEIELIKPDLNNPYCLNENCGSLYSLRAISESLKRNWEDPEYNEKHSLHLRQNGHLAREKALGEESRQKRKETLKLIQHQQGENNSQFGTIWITNGTRDGNLKLRKDQEIPEGFWRGRTLR